MLLQLVPVTKFAEKVLDGKLSRRIFAGSSGKFKSFFFSNGTNIDIFKIDAKGSIVHPQPKVVNRVSTILSNMRRTKYKIDKTLQD